MLTIGEPISTVEVKVLTSQKTHKLSIRECNTVAVCDQRVFAPNKNAGDKGWIISLGTKVCELIEQFVLKVRPF